MPLQILTVRRQISTRGPSKVSRLENVVVPAIFELFTDAAADPYDHFRRDRQVPAIEESMEVLSQEETIRDIVRSALAERLDVGGFQRGKGSFASDRATSVIGVGDDEAEGPLTEAGSHKDGSAIALSVFTEEPWFWCFG